MKPAWSTWNSVSKLKPSLMIATSVFVCLAISNENKLCIKTLHWLVLLYHTHAVSPMEVQP